MDQNKDKSRREATIRHKKIEVQQLYRRNPDIGLWRRALRLAESVTDPDRLRLYMVYEEAILDTHLFSVIQRIVLRCTNDRIIFVKDGKPSEDEDMNHLLESTHFINMMKHIVDSKFWGHSLIQCDFLQGKGGGVQLIPRLNVRPEFGDILKRYGNKADSINFRKAPFTNFLLEVGDPFELGLLNKAVASVIYKRFGVKDWAEFLEVYGMPIREITYDPNAPGQKVEAEKAVRQEGSNAGFVLPEGSTFKLHDSAKAGNSQAFDMNAQFHNREISKLFLLQTMTTENGSSQSQAQVHQEAENEVIRGYRLFVERVLNHKLLPLLKRHGYDVDGGKFKYDDSEKLSKSELLERYIKLADIIDIPLEHIYEMFNIPMPTDKEEKTGKTKKKEKEIEEKEKESKLHFHREKNCCELPGGIKLSFDSSFTDGLVKRIFDSKNNDDFDKEAFEELESHLLEGFEGGWDSTDIDYNSEDIIRKRMMELNVTRFSAAATMKMAMELNAAKAAASGWSDFKMAAEKLLGTYNANYLRTEYNLAVATAQNASNYIRLKKDMEILPYWKYQTVGDGRVRSSHQALDGKVLKADDPIWDNIYPPNGYGCRCEVIALSDLDGEELSDSDDALNSLGEEYGKMQERGFDKNRGELAIVYADAQLYMDAAFGSRLSYKQYGLDSFENLQKTKADIPSTSRTYEETKEWFDDKATDGEIMTDGWDNIPVRLGFDALRKHRYKHKHEGRFNYMEAVLDTIRNPDEVYLKKLGENRFEMNLFGIYKDEVLMIPVSTDDFEFNIKTWFLLKKEKDSRRTGILLRG